MPSDFKLAMFIIFKTLHSSHLSLTFVVPWAKTQLRDKLFAVAGLQVEHCEFHYICWMIIYTASANGTVVWLKSLINTLPYVSVRADALLCTYLYIGVYDAAQMSNGLCSSYFRSHASVGVFSLTARIFRVYNQCNDGRENFSQVAATLHVIQLADNNIYTVSLLFPSKW